MGKFEVGQKALINKWGSALHGTEVEIVGINGENVRIKILSGFEYRWCRADELEAAPAAEPPADVQAGAHRPKLGDALTAFREADANALFKKAHQSGNYDDMRAAMFALQAENAQLRAVLAADDPSGYSELLDELGGQIKRLERELAAAHEALRACIHADIVGDFSAEEVAKRYFEARGE